ncbi:MAG: chemotaxis protein CheB [bacterium]
MKTDNNSKYYEAVVIGVSAGGIQALEKIIPPLPGDFKAPIIIVQHRHQHSDNYQIQSLDKISALTVKEAEEKETITRGSVYFAPSDHHLLIEGDKTFSLCSGELVCYARPSVDVTFESASEIYGTRLIGILLTGSNSDGSNGMKCIKDRGGLTIVEDPTTAQFPVMPQRAIDTTDIDYIADLDTISTLLIKLVMHARQGER